jgi:hypothetical protein
MGLSRRKGWTSTLSERLPKRRIGEKSHQVATIPDKTKLAKKTQPALLYLAAFHHRVFYAETPTKNKTTHTAGAAPPTAVTSMVGLLRKATPSGTGSGEQVREQDVGSTGLSPAKPKPHWQTLFTHSPPGCEPSVEPQSEGTVQAEAREQNNTHTKNNILEVGIDRDQT